MSQTRKACVDLGLEVIEALRPEGVSLTIDDIAEVCGCSRMLIWLIEKAAIKKLRAEFSRRENGMKRLVASMQHEKEGA